MILNKYLQVLKKGSDYSSFYCAHIYAACLSSVLFSLALILTLLPFMLTTCKFGFCECLVALKECDLLLPASGFFSVAFFAIIPSIQSFFSAYTV